MSSQDLEQFPKAVKRNEERKRALLAEIESGKSELCDVADSGGQRERRASAHRSGEE